MKSPMEMRDKSKYYHFHEDYDYDTKECQD